MWLTVTANVFCQDWWWTYSSGGGVTAEDIYNTYAARVTADGGVIINEAYTLSLIQDAIDNGYWDDTYLMLDSKAGVRFVSDTTVFYWYDIKGNNDFKRSMVGTEPNFYAADSSFIFDDDRLYNTTKANWIFLHSSASSVFINASIGFTADTDSLWGLLATGGFGTTQVGYEIMSDSRTTSDGKIYCWAANGSSVVIQHVTADLYFPVQTYGVLSVITDPTNATGNQRQFLYYDNGSENNGNSQTGAVSTSNPIDNIHIGAAGNGTAQVLHGHIKTIIVMKALATSDQQTAIYNKIK